MYLTKRYKAYRVFPNKNLVCNAITGEIASLSDQAMLLFEALGSGEDQPYPPRLLEELERKRFLFDSQAQEEAAFVRVCEASYAEFLAQVPRQFVFILNTHCNFNCPYCFEHEDFRAHASTLSEAQIAAAFAVIDAKMQEDGQSGAPQLEIFGGEPLLPAARPNLEIIMGQLEKRGLAASLQTNGYTLTRFIDFFVRYQKTVRQIQVTLDGPPHIHNRRRVPRSGEPTFDTIVAGIDQLLQQQLPIRIALRINVDRDNVDYLEEMASFYASKGWLHHPQINIVAAPVDNRSASSKKPELLLGWHELFERLLPLSTDAGGPFDLSVFKPVEYFRYYMATIGQPNAPQRVFVPKILYCEAAALKLFAFHPDGNIYPCPESVGMQAMAIGTYAPHWQMDEQRAGQWSDQTILNRERCRTCEISTFCGGGCVLNALLHNGSMASPECDHAPELLDAYFRWLSQDHS